MSQISRSMTGGNSHSHEKLETRDTICTTPFLPTVTVRIFCFLRLTLEVNFLDLVRAASFALSFGMSLAEKGLLVRVPIKNVRSYSSMAS